MRKFLFRNDSPEVYSELRSRIVSQIETYLPAVMIKDLNVFSEGQVLNIRLTYFIDGILSDDILNLSLDLNSIR
jgi:hypothetical protein